MYKELLLDKLGIESLNKFANFIEENRSFEELQIDNVRINGRDIKIYKAGHSVSLESENGDLLTVSVIDKNQFEFDRREVKFMFRFPNKDFLVIDGSTSALQDGLDKEELIDSLKVHVIKADGETHDLDWTLTPSVMEETDEGIKYHNMILSYDGETILKINDESVPSFESIKSFDINEEKEKINKIINNEKIELNDVTKKYLIEAMDKLDKKSNYLKKSNKDYEYVTNKVSHLVDVKNSVLDGIENYTINEKDIDESTSWLNGLCKELVDKYDIQNIKKLVKKY
jgi:hypothetical protein